MNTNANNDLYEARLRIGDTIIFKVSGQVLGDLQITLTSQCEIEQSGLVCT